MKLLFFLEFGKHGLAALWIPYGLVTAWLLIQTVIAHNSGGYKQGAQGQAPTLDNKKTPLWKIPQFKGAIILTIIAIVVHFCIQASYK